MKSFAHIFPGLWPVMLLLCLPAFAPAAGTSESTEPRSTVALVRDPAAVQSLRVDPVRARRMVDRAVQLATGTESPSAAWRTLVSPSDRVGIKVQSEGGPFFCSHPAVIRAVVDGLVASGVSRNRIVVFDRDLAQLNKAGITAASVACRVQGIGAPNGYDREQFFVFAISGRLIWGDLLFARASGTESRSEMTSLNVSDRSHFSRIFAHEIDKLISIPVLSSSTSHGISGTLVNVTAGQVDNWRRLGGRPHFGEAAIPQLYAGTAIMKKTVFHLMDGLVAQYAGGPGFDPKYALPLGVVIAGKDPVAVDRVALTEIEVLRAANRFASVEKAAMHIVASGKIGLGEHELARIRLKTSSR